MRELRDILYEGMGHLNNRLGGGSSGVVYDLKNGFVKKTLRIIPDPNKPSTRIKEYTFTDRWAKIKKGLTVIPYIYKWDGMSYEMEKFETNCAEGKWISTAINILYTARRSYWNDNQIKKLKNKLGEDKAEWVMNWFDLFIHDGDMIVGNDSWSDDIREMNIGKTKSGDVVCFDWFDPFC